MPLPLVPLLLRIAALVRAAHAVQRLRERKPMKGWRTIAVNVAAILAVIGAHWSFDLPVGTWEVLVLGAINLGLRIITTTPVGGAK